MGGNTGNFRTSGTTSATNGTRTLASMLVSGNSASSYSRIAMFDKLHGKNVDNSGDSFWANTPSTSDGNAIFYDGNVVIGGNVSSRQTLSLLNSSTDVNEGGLYLSNGNINVDCYSVQTAKDAVVGELNFYNGFLQGSNSSSLLKTSVQCLVNETGSSATNLNFVLNGVQKMRLNSQGLNVNGSFNNVNGALNLASTVKTNADDVISTINFYNGTDNAAIRSSIKSCVVPTEDAPNNSDLRFFTQPDAIDQVERMRIASDGVVTINNDLILGKKLYINENGESIAINGDQKIIAGYRGEIREFYIGQSFQNSANLYISNDLADGQIFINSGSESRITMTSRGLFFNRITNNVNEYIGNVGASNSTNSDFHVISQNAMYIQSGPNDGTQNMQLVSGTGHITLRNSNAIYLTTPVVELPKIRLTSSTDNAIAIGAGAGATSQQTASIAIGLNAGATQSSTCVALGNLAGNSGQQSEAIAIGLCAGQTSQGAGYAGSADGSISIGTTAGQVVQASRCIAIGGAAGNFEQKPQAIAIGYAAGSIRQASSCIAIGALAGQQNQGTNSIAIGSSAGNGVLAGEQNLGMGISSIAIGASAGNAGIGDASIYIGAGCGQTVRHTRCILLSASGGDYSPSVVVNNQNTQFGGATFINPLQIRILEADQRLGYNSITGEVTRVTSSLRYKKDINDLESNTSVLHLFQPKEFRYINSDDNSQKSYGFIAEELNEIDPALVFFNKEGQPDSICWNKINTYTICEVQKLRKELDELKELMKSLSK
jgi:hypothetical protein